MGFLIWSMAGLFFVGMGIYARRSKKATGFWANVEMFEVTDINKYNRAMGRLWSTFGIVWILLGLPLLKPNSPWILLSVLGIFGEILGAILVYTQVITPKYQKKKEK